MSVSLKKGQKISLTKDNNGLSRLIVGLGWDEAEKRRLFSSKANHIDCDASAILLRNGKYVSKSDVVCYSHLKHSSGSVIHCGDNLTGEGEGDDEQIIIDLPAVPYDIDRIVIVVNIYQPPQGTQHFGMIKNAFIRIVDARSNSEMCRYSLTDDYSGMRSLIFGEVYRHNNEWKFNPMGQGTDDHSIDELAARYK